MPSSTAVTGCALVSAQTITSRAADDITGLLGAPSGLGDSVPAKGAQRLVGAQPTTRLVQLQRLQRLAQHALRTRLGDEVCGVRQQCRLVGRAARADNNFGLRPTRHDGMREVAAVHYAGHVDVSSEERDPSVRLQVLERAVRVLGL